MNHYLVKKASLKGSISVPSSKSHTLRAILFASLAHGKSFIYSYLPSPDTKAMIDACRVLGAKIYIHPHYLEIIGTGGKVDYASDIIHAGNSGIVARFCAAVGALSSNPIVITGDESIRYQRPMKELLHGLRQLQVDATSLRGDDYAPLVIKGPLKPGQAQIFGEDSQPVSAILIASAFVKGKTELKVKNPGEKPWVALTLHWFDKLGISYRHHNYEHYEIEGPVKYLGFEYTVPGDLSSAAFPIAAALVTGSELTIRNVDMSDPQGDKELIFVLQKMGALIEIEQNQKCLHVKASSSLTGLSIDINDFIDSITILSVIGCFAEGETKILNASVAKQKECNRIQSITKELRKMGAEIEETDDGLIVKKSFLKGADVESYHDHRMAMSLTVAGLAAEGDTRISSIECISKTFPTFLQDFNALGAGLLSI